jgi:hypothetical protein
MLLSLSKTCHAPFAATVTAFSTYLMAFGIHVLLAAVLRFGGGAKNSDCYLKINCGDEYTSTASS